MNTLAHQGKPACFPRSRLRRVCEGREGGSEENKLSYVYLSLSILGEEWAADDL